MNITLNNLDPVNATITVAIAKEDYQPKVEKALNDIRKNIVLDGFRKGNAPKSRIQSMYGKSVLVDEINQLVSDKLYDYLKESNLNVLGEPLPSQEPKEPLNFDTQEDYEFTFDVAIAPEMDVKLEKSDKLTYYTIAISDDMVDKQINNFKANYGTYVSVDSVEEKDMVKGLLTEADGDTIVEDAVLMPAYIKVETEKAKILAAKKDDIITFNPYTAYEGHEAELASLLKIAKEDINKHQGDFTFTIVDITRYQEAEMNQELFDKAYEPGTVTSEEDFKAKIKEDLAQQTMPESDYKFLLDAKDALEEKTKDIQFPDAFLKRWLVAADEKNTAESIETDYPNILSDLKFQLIKDKLLKDNNIAVEKEDVEKQAYAAARAQFIQYGMNNIPDYLLENYVQEMMKKEKTVQNLIHRVMENKLIEILKKTVTLKKKEVSIEEFQKLFEK